MLDFCSLFPTVHCPIVVKMDNLVFTVEKAVEGENILTQRSVVKPMEFPYDSIPAETFDVGNIVASGAALPTPMLLNRSSLRINSELVKFENQNSK